MRQLEDDRGSEATGTDGVLGNRDDYMRAGRCLLMPTAVCTCKKHFFKHERMLRPFAARKGVFNTHQFLVAHTRLSTQIPDSLLRSQHAVSRRLIRIPSTRPWRISCYGLSCSLVAVL